MHDRRMAHRDSRILVAAEVKTMSDTDSQIVEKLAVEVMGWTVYPYPESERIWFQVPGEPDRRSWHQTLGCSFNPLTSISDAFMCLGRGEWDYVIRKSRADQRYHVWIINSTWAANNPDKIPPAGDPNQLGAYIHEELPRAISKAIVSVRRRAK